jgi:hypothetical protein
MPPCSWPSRTLRAAQSGAVHRSCLSCTPRFPKRLRRRHDVRLAFDRLHRLPSDKCEELHNARCCNDERAGGPDIHNVILAQPFREDAGSKPTVAADIHASEEDNESHAAIIRQPRGRRSTDIARLRGPRTGHWMENCGPAPGSATISPSIISVAFVPNRACRDGVNSPKA